MRLSWNEIRVRASQFASEWKDSGYEKGESQTFYNEFFNIFGVTRRRVASFEEPVKKLDAKYGFIDLFWKGILLVEQKSVGGNLTKAKQQAFDYFPGLKEAELPRHVLVSDFQTFDLYNLEEGTERHFALSDLHKNIEHFSFILGVEKRTFRDQDPVNIEASELMGELHDALKASGYEGHELEQLLVRLIFCLFADDTGIFEPRGIFLELVEQRTAEDGSDIGLWLSQLFDVLDTPIERRQRKLDEDLQQFPYVNGDLFHERLRISSFDSTMRKMLLKSCNFSWDAISPAIFGSLFQSVMNAEERRAAGAHYTTEKNILKVIQPLFLDGLRDDFMRLKARRDTGRTNALKSFQETLGGLTFFDPACGCGNFLIIAYRELRELEIEVLRELNPRGQRVIDVAALSKINVNQFYGIEISEFPVRIAEVALWMMDHIMNNKLSLEFGESYARIPLKTSPHIYHADALEIEWATVLSATDCSYVLGNPPFVGAKLQTELQRNQVRQIAQLGGSGGTLDYVAAWFLKAGAYVQKGSARIGFVATNSITQGEQVAQLWPGLFNKCNLEIAFAHRTFAWGSDARGKAHVHVVIIGLTSRAKEPATKRLFSYDKVDSDPVESQHGALSPYLFDASKLTDRHLVVQESVYPVATVPKMLFGNMPNDGGHLILSAEEREIILKQEPDIYDLIRPLVGAHDLINGEKRYCFWLVGASPTKIRHSRIITERLEKVRQYRAASKRAATRALAATPALFGEIRHTGEPFVIIPRHSSERREYIPIDFNDGLSIAHDSCVFVPGASLFDFSVLTSAMHMTWLRHIGGRLKNDYRYSAGLVLNTFPWPTTNDLQRSKIVDFAKGILDARALFPNSSLADMYDPDVMPAELRKAHRVLDGAIDKLYRGASFSGDRERAEYLLGLYEKLMSPLTASLKQKKSKKR